MFQQTSLDEPNRRHLPRAKSRHTKLVADLRRQNIQQLKCKPDTRRVKTGHVVIGWMEIRLYKATSAWDARCLRMHKPKLFECEFVFYRPLSGSRSMNEEQFWGTAGRLKYVYFILHLCLFTEMPEIHNLLQVSVINSKLALNDI